MRSTAFAPARWPAERPSPRRVPHRPFPSITTATCSGELAWDSTLLCITKLHGKNFSDGGEALGDLPAHGRRGGARRRGGVGDDLLELGEVVEEAPTAGGRQPTGRVRPVVPEALLDLDQAGLLEDAEMPAQIAVGQATEVLQVAEREPLRLA